MNRNLNADILGIEEICVIESGIKKRGYFAMRKKSELEMERARIVKITRSMIRLKHSLRADEEINAVLPDTIREFDEGLQAGDLQQALLPSIDDLMRDR